MNKKSVWVGSKLRDVKLAADISFSKLGFQFHNYDEADPNIPEWRRDCFKEHFASISIFLDQRALSIGALSFTVFLSIVSKRQSDFERRAHISLRPDVGPQHREVTLLGVDLNWLMAVWPPSLQSFSEAMLRWEGRPLSEGKEIMQDVFYYLTNQGERFFDMSKSAEGLITTLLEIEDFPGRRGPGGPVSQAPHLYAASLLSEVGRYEEAINVIREFEERLIHDRFNKKISEKSFLLQEALADKYRKAIFFDSKS